MKPVVVVRKLCQSFGAQKPVLRDIDLSINEGEALAVMGENGSGKTTLLKILTTLITPTSGEVFVFDKSVARESKKIKPLLGWAPANDSGFFSRFTGLENLALFGSFYGMAKGQVDQALQPWRELPPLVQALSTPFYLCSAGMKQSLTLCRAFLPRPRLVFLDEPTRSLDQQTARALRDHLGRVRGNTTLVIATHNDEDVRALQARVVHLKDGRVA